MFLRIMWIISEGRRDWEVLGGEMEGSLILELRVYLVLGRITLTQLHSYVLSNRRQDDFEEISFS